MLLHWNPNDTFCTNKKSILKFKWNFKGSWTAKTILKSSIKLQDSYLFPYFKPYYKAAVITTVCFWYNRHGQRNTTERPEMNSCVHHQMIFDKSAKIIQWGKRQSSQETVLEITHINMYKNEAGSLIYTQKWTKKWIQDLKLLNS